jgi:hypothetical protein
MNSSNAATSGLNFGLRLALVLIGISATSVAQEPPQAPAEEQPGGTVEEQPWSGEEPAREEPAEAEESGADETDIEDGEAKKGNANKGDARKDEARKGDVKKDEATKGDTGSNSRNEAERESPATPEERPTEPKSAKKAIERDALGFTQIEVTPRTPWGVEIGLGPLIAWVPDDRFDLFSESGSWPAFAARASASVWSDGPLDVAASASYQFAATSGQVRQTPTELSIHRYLMGGQARHRLLSWLAPYGRILAGFADLNSRLGTGNEDEVPKLSRFAFTALAGAGIQAQVFNLPRSGLLMHLYVEGGSIFTPNTDLVYRTGSGGPPRAQPIDVGTILLSGPYLETGALARF